MVKLKLKLKKVGNSYGLIVPKALIDTGVLSEHEEDYIVEIIRNRNNTVSGISATKSNDAISKREYAREVNNVDSGT